MATSRLLRPAAAVFAATALLISGCSAGSSSPDPDASGVAREGGAERAADDGDAPSSTPCRRPFPATSARTTTRS